MRVKELEKEIRAMPPRQLARFSDWFDGFRRQLATAKAGNNHEEPVSDEQKQEILRRRAGYLANPSTATLWPGSAQRLIKRLRARRQKTATGRG